MKKTARRRRPPLTLTQRFTLKDAAGALMDLAQDIEACNTFAGEWPKKQAYQRAKAEHTWLLALVDRLNNFERKPPRKSPCNVEWVRIKRGGK